MSTGSIEFTYDPKTGIRTATYRGVVDDDCMLEAYRNLIEQPDFVPMAHDLADLRQMVKLDLSRQGLARLGDLLSGPGPVEATDEFPGLAMVADSPLTYGLARMYEMMTAPLLPKKIEVFDKLEDAVEWLMSLPRFT